MSQRLPTFLAALQDADPDTLCSPPGLGGLWKVKHVRSGLHRQVLVKHHSGLGLAFRIPSSHGCCRECALEKRICEHCNCALCVWEHEVDERTSPQVAPARLQQLIARLKAFEMGKRHTPVALEL